MPEGVPYYQPVAPETPTNTGLDVARIVASSDLAGSFTRGLASAAQATAARQRLQLESEQMITDAALKSRQLDILSENNVMDFKVGLKNADALANYRNTRATIEGDPNNPLGLAGRVNLAREKLATFADFNKRAKEYGLLDPNPKNPVKYYANYQRLNDEFAFADDMQEIKNALGTFKARTENHTVPIKFGRTFDEDKGEWTGGSETKNVAVGQVVENLNDPDKADETVKLLEANGLTVSKPEVKKPLPDSRGWFDKWMYPEKAPMQTIKEETLGPSLSYYAKMAAGVDFSRGKSRTPTAGVVVPNAGAEAAAPSITQDSVDEAGTAIATEAGQSVSTPPLVTATAPSKEALFPQTETEKILAQAKRAAAKPGANVDGIKAYLKSKGIDPNQL